MHKIQSENILKKTINTILPSEYNCPESGFYYILSLVFEEDGWMYKLITSAAPLDKLHAVISGAYLYVLTSLFIQVFFSDSRIYNVLANECFFEIHNHHIVSACDFH